jgi:dienelactone hydrolase
MFAAHGYPVLSLAYFGASGVPATLERIPLEYFARAAALLARQPGVDPRHVLAWGVSRGGEAAMLLGVHYPQLVHGVIATSTSDHVYAGLPDAHAPAWTLHGRPFPFGSASDFSIPGAPSSPASVIPVERIAGPVITVCGAADALIPSCPFAEAIAHRRGDRGTRLGDIHLAYPRSGHLVGGLDSYFSTTTVDGRVANGSVLSLGGTIVDNAEDAGTAHSRLLAFLAALQ